MLRVDAGQSTWVELISADDLLWDSAHSFSSVCVRPSRGSQPLREYPPLSQPSPCRLPALGNGSATFPAAQAPKCRRPVNSLFPLSSTPARRPVALLPSTRPPAPQPFSPELCSRPELSDQLISTYSAKPEPPFKRIPCPQ